MQNEGVMTQWGNEGWGSYLASKATTAQGPAKMPLHNPAKVCRVSLPPLPPLVGTMECKELHHVISPLIFLSYPLDPLPVPVNSESSRCDLSHIGLNGATGASPSHPALLQQAHTARSPTLDFWTVSSELTCNVLVCSHMGTLCVHFVHTVLVCTLGRAHGNPRVHTVLVCTHLHSSLVLSSAGLMGTLVCTHELHKWA